jgi:hypothetical protein
MSEANHRFPETATYVAVSRRRAHLIGSCVLGEGAVAGAEHEVAFGESAEGGADGVDDAGDIEAGN